MRKAALLAILVLVSSSVAAAHHGPTKIKIDAAAKKQPAVPFDHEKHSTTLAKSCDKCHHQNKGMTADTAAKMKVAKCSTCHLDPKPNVPGMREMSLQKNPFHIACINCHKEQKKGPTVCKDCHVK